MTFGPKDIVPRDFDKEWREGTEGRLQREWFKSQGVNPGDLRERERFKYARVYDDVTTGKRYIWFTGTDPTKPKELWEDFDAFYGGKPKLWEDMLENFKMRYGYESDDVHYGGFSRGGGLARVMGGTGYGSYMPDKYQPREGSKEAGEFSDLFHETVVPAMNAVSPVVSEIDDAIMHDIYDALPKPVRDVFDPFDDPPKASKTVYRDYSGFACSFVGFPAKIKYSRKGNIFGSTIANQKRGRKRSSAMLDMDSAFGKGRVQKYRDSPAEM